VKAWSMAPCYYLPAHAEFVVARITSWAAMGDPVSHGPGLDQGDAVQFAAHMAFLRHVCAFGDRWDRVAWYRGTQFWGVRTAGTGGPNVAGLVWYPIVGEEPFCRAPFGSSGLGDEWNRQLALACDTVLRRLAKAETADAVVPGWGGEFPGGGEAIPSAIGVGGIAIIVAGAAVAVIGTAAAWRYFSPEARIEAASIAAAAQAYEARLVAQMQTGVEMPPSPIEQAQAERVRAAAKASETNHYLVGGAAVAGLGGGMTLASLIRSRVSP